ncbi:hypothetical protein, partial [Pseudomonas sp. BF-B-18]|uniref:hypothetical protein n=2 Tax=unclassified Pseudomonas TaxID=196821 RepID=UPI001CC0FA4F
RLRCTHRRQLRLKYRNRQQAGAYSLSSCGAGVLGVDRTQDELNVVNFPWRAKSPGAFYTSATPSKNAKNREDRKPAVQVNTRQSVGQRIARMNKPDEYAR